MKKKHNNVTIIENSNLFNLAYPP